MSLSDDYRQYASQCLESAAKALTDDERQQFLNMARAWTQAALRLEGAGTPREVISIEHGRLPAGNEALGRRLSGRPRR